MGSAKKSSGEKKHVWWWNPPINIWLKHVASPLSIITPINIHHYPFWKNPKNGSLIFNPSEIPWYIPIIHNIYHISYICIYIYMYTYAYDWWLIQPPQTLGPFSRTVQSSQSSSRGSFSSDRSKDGQIFCKASDRRWVSWPKTTAVNAKRSALRSSSNSGGKSLYIIMYV